LRRRYFCPRDEEPLDRDEIVRGYEVEDDTFVVVSDEELESLAPEKSRDIDLQAFVERHEIDPLWVDRGYFLVPSGGSTKPYRLLAATMEKSGRAGVATFVMRGKAYLVAIFSDHGILRAQTLRYHDEIRALEEIGIGELPEPEEETVATMLEDIESLGIDELDTTQLENRHTRRLEALVAEKRDEGRDIVQAEEEEHRKAEAIVIDLMQVLKERLTGAATEDEREADEAEPARGKGPLASRSKDELYARAQELGIEGRSRMTKDELIEAIRHSA
jgi:DNA end-binding protein Ku